MEELKLYEEALSEIDNLKAMVKNYESLFVKVANDTCYTTFTVLNHPDSKIVFEISNTFFHEGLKVIHTAYCYLDKKLKVTTNLGLDYTNDDFCINLVKAKNGYFPQGLPYSLDEDNEPVSGFEGMPNDTCILIDKASVKDLDIGSFFLQNTIKAVELIDQTFPFLSRDKIDKLKVDIVASVSDYKNLLRGEVSDIELNDVNVDTKKSIVKTISDVLESQKVIVLRNNLEENLSETTPKVRKMKV